MSNRFKVLASVKEHILIPDRWAIRVELHQGLDSSEHPEIVVAKLFRDSNKGTWEYGKAHMRFVSQKDVVKYVLEGIKTMYECSAKHSKKVSKNSLDSALDSMSSDELTALEAALAKAKAAKATPLDNSIAEKLSKKSSKKSQK